MEYLVEISKTCVYIHDIESKYIKTYYEIHSGWTAKVDKADNFIIIKLADSEEHHIHLCMLPADKVSVIWKDIDYLYKMF